MLSFATKAGQQELHVDADVLRHSIEVSSLNSFHHGFRGVHVLFPHKPMEQSSKTQRWGGSR